MIFVILCSLFSAELYLAKSELDDIKRGNVRKNLTENIENIEKDIEYINTIVQDLQDYAKPIKVIVEEADLKEVIDEVVKKQCSQHYSKCILRVEEDAKRVTADPNLLKRIIGNLLQCSASYA